MKEWRRDGVLDKPRLFQQAAVVTAAAEFGVFNAFGGQGLSADQLAEVIRADGRATEKLADALVAVGMLGKEEGVYLPAPGTEQLLGTATPRGHLQAADAPGLPRAGELLREERVPVVDEESLAGERKPSSTSVGLWVH